MWRHGKNEKTMTNRPHHPDCFCYACEEWDRTMARDAKEQAEEPLPRTTCSAWVAVSERLPADFQMVLMSGRHLGYYVGSIRDGRWRVYTPLHSGDGRRIMIEDIPSPEYWMPLPHLPNVKVVAPPSEGEACNQGDQSNPERQPDSERDGGCPPTACSLSSSFEERSGE